MTGSRISTTVTSTVVLDTRHYASPLTVTRTGVIDVTQTYGSAGIYGAQTGDEVINRGAITAASGSAYSATMPDSGGVGIDLTATGTIINSGTITGGNGGYRAGNGSDNSGGNGIDAVGGRIVNVGTILGGNTTTDTDTQGSGAGAGVDLSGPGVDMTNSGTIIGGYAKYAAGGAGVEFTAAGTLHNLGVIIGGGAVYGSGGSGVVLSPDGILFNAGTIDGAQGAAGLAAVDSTTTNVGTITGGAGNVAYYHSHYFIIYGGAGVSLSGGELTNNGVITGGQGSYIVGEYDYVTAGGVGVSATGGSLVNNGTIEGGAGLSNKGNYGVTLNDGATLTNHGTIIGGLGINFNSRFNGDGGAGVLIQASSSAVNLGVIMGGDDADTTADGGAGVILKTGTLLTNMGTIIGGAGGPPKPGGLPSHYYHGAFAGAAVQIYGGTLVTAGTLIGGAPGMGSQGSGKPGDAVQFLGTIGGTLVVEAGAVFDGDIVGLKSQDDTLVLAGNKAGTLSGFGTTITALTTISEEANMRWTLEGAITGSGSVELGTGAYLALTGGTVSIASIVFGAGGVETLSFDAPAGVTSKLSGFGAGDRIDLASVQASSLSYAHGTLTLFDASHAVVDTLAFSGNYTAADFVLQREGMATDVVYAGSHATSLVPPLANFSPWGGGHILPSFLEERPIMLNR